MAQRHEHNLGVSRSRETVRAFGLQFAAQFEVVVNLPVEHQRVVANGKRLVGPFARVEDAQPAVPKDHVFFVRPQLLPHPDRR